MNGINKKKLHKSEEKSIRSGLIVENSIKVSYSKDSNIMTSIILTVIAFMGLFGTVFSFITMFDIKVNTVSLIFWIVISFTLFSIISILPDRCLIAIFPILLIFIYVFQDYSQEFIVGYKIVYNHIANVMSEADVWSKYYDIPNDVIAYEYATTFLKFCVFLLSGLICLFTIKVQSCIAGFILTFPFLECGLYFGAIPKYTYFFMIISYWIALLSMTFSGYRKNTKNRQAGFVRIGNSFFAKSDCNFKISEKVGMSTAIMCLVCALLSNFIVSISDYQRSDNINSIRNNIKDTIDNISIDDASYFLSRLGNMFSSGANGSFNGTLGQKDVISYKGEEKLVLSTSIIPSNDIYLKNYVGSIYTGNSWDKIPDNKYTTSIIKTFESTNIYPQMLAVVILSDSFPSYTMKVSPTNKQSKNISMPYYSVAYGSYSYINDTTIKFDDSSEYVYSVLEVSSKVVLQNLDSLNLLDSLYLDEYEDFINEYYLAVDDTESMQRIKDIFKEYLNSCDIDFDTFNATASIYEKIEYIKKFLCSNYDYTLSPGKTPLDQDYVLYFLEECQEGYCSHFASSGTLLCRMMGIPARYVEGYYVSHKNFESNVEITIDSDENIYTLSVKDETAHAWTEIYIDGLGWINVEFTPGFNDNPTYESFQSETTTPPNDGELDTNTIEDTSQEIQTQIALVTEVTTEISSESDTTSQPITDTTEPDKPLISPETLKTIKHIILVIFAIALTVALIVMRRKYILNKRNQTISGENIRASILESYRYTLLILKYLKIVHDDTIPYLQFATEVSTSIDYAQTFPDIMNIVLKSKMSTLTLSVEEKNIVKEFAQRMATNTFDRLSRIQKIWFKYGLCLI